MSLKKKIILSFSLAAFLVALLALFEYINFVAIRSEIRFLELTDSIRSKSLQLRRHEKNFFLYGPLKSEDESKEIYRYLDELGELLAAPFPRDKSSARALLRDQVMEYRKTFGVIRRLHARILRGLNRSTADHTDSAIFFPLIKSAIYERPSQAADFLMTIFHYPAGQPIIKDLLNLDRQITSLRKTGEDIIYTAKEMDRNARDNVEAGIGISQVAIIIIFPLFLVVGLSMLFLIAKNIVNRLGLLIEVIEKTGKGQFSHVAIPAAKLGNDEVGLLIRKFDQMEDQLAERESELEYKNRELLQSKKLAAIGTLAAGVAHELNNPLNNIYLSTQVLARKTGAVCPAEIKEVIADILGQTARVKQIVKDILEFAGGREPRLQEVNLSELIAESFHRLAVMKQEVAFTLESDPDGVVILADREQLKQVFINLFTNAVEAMEGRGGLAIKVVHDMDIVTIQISDTGKGISKEAIEKIFEPFYTTKEKGTGLGLAIVFNIVRKHGGEITVNSDEGKGTTFTIILPRQKKKASEPATGERRSTQLEKEHL